VSYPEEPDRKQHPDLVDPVESPDPFEQASLERQYEGSLQQRAVRRYEAYVSPDREGNRDARRLLGRPPRRAQQDLVPRPSLVLVPVATLEVAANGLHRPRILVIRDIDAFVALGRRVAEHGLRRGPGTLHDLQDPLVRRCRQRRR
jgi:hypothetical protein